MRPDVFFFFMNPNELLLVGVPGKELDAATAERLRRLQPGAGKLGRVSVNTDCLPIQL